MSTPAKTEKPVNPYRIRLDGVVLSYPHLFKPQRSMDSDQLKYSAAFILDKENHAEQIKKLQLLTKKIIAEKHTGKTIPPDRIFLRDGSAKPDTEGYSEDNMFFNAGNTSKPAVVKRDRQPAVESDDLFYPGAIVNALVTIWYQKNDHGVRVNASLEAVQFAKHGNRIGAAPVDPESVFDELEDDASDDDMM